MANQHLLRCSHCFVVRIEEVQRPCPICYIGTLQITTTKFKLGEIDRHRVQDLLKSLMTSSTNNKDLEIIPLNEIRAYSILNEIGRRMCLELFCGNQIYRDFSSHFSSQINSIIANYISQLNTQIKTITDKVNFCDTDSVIAFVRIQLIAKSNWELAEEILQLIKGTFNLTITNDLVCCEHCLTLYRSYGLSECIFCREQTVKLVQRNIIKQSYESSSRIFTKLIQIAEENSFYNFQDILLAFIITYHSEKKQYSIKILTQLKEDIKKIQWGNTSLLQLHNEIYDLIERFKLLSEPDISTDYPVQNEKARMSTYDCNYEKTHKYDSSLSASVFSPSLVSIEESFLIQVFIHENDLADKVRNFATEADTDTSKRYETNLNINQSEANQLDITIINEDLKLDETNLSVKWYGGIASAQFIATVPKTCTKSNIICQILISTKSIPIGQMKFKTKVMVDNSKKHLPEDVVSVARFEKYKNIFISYASEDRSEVMKRVQILNALKIDFFQDVFSLEPGQNWEDTLYDEISASDAFFLFWSSSAARSNWVKKEIVYALNVKKGKEENPPHIIPIIIEGPPPPAPPRELEFLHFNDKLLYFITK